MLGDYFVVIELLVFIFSLLKNLIIIQIERDIMRVGIDNIDMPFMHIKILVTLYLKGYDI